MQIGTQPNPFTDEVIVAQAPVGTSLNTYSLLSSTNATTIITSATAYISSIVIVVTTIGTTSTITIQDKSGTPLAVVNEMVTTALNTAPTIYNFQTPIKMTDGIDIITAGVAAATLNVFINYYQ